MNKNMNVACRCFRKYGIVGAVSLCLLSLNVLAVDLPVVGSQEIKVGISADLPYAVVNHHGQEVVVKRIQDTGNRMVDDFAKTSRVCPPFCIHPIEAAPGVRTVGEIELIKFLQNEVPSGRGLFIDARMPNWYENETIPGAVNIPFVLFTDTSENRDGLLKLFGATVTASGELDFSQARSLYLFCNGPWCDQSPRAIKGLLAAGYPAEKLFYYRGGMQLWKLFSLTTVVPKSNEVEE